MNGTRFIFMPKQRFAGWCEAKQAEYKCITHPGAAVLSRIAVKPGRMCRVKAKALIKIKKKPE